MASRHVCPQCRGEFAPPTPYNGEQLFCPRCRVALAAVVAPSSNEGVPWGKALLWGLGALATYKFVLQPVLDEEYPGRVLPQSVRDRLKADHVASNGPTCPRCDGDAAWEDLVIDHILPFALGGRTSVQNSQVLCRWCNTDKGASATILDYLRGRGSRSF